MRDTHHFAYLTFFIAIEIVMSLVPMLGFIPLGFINATTLHIPVIAAGILLSKKDGAIVGFVFGLFSFLKSTFEPNLTSFLFSPFYAIGSVSGNPLSLVIAFGPRMLVGYMSGLIFERLNIKREDLKVLISTFISSFVFNTGLAMALAYILFKEEYAEVFNIALNGVFGVIMGVVFSSGVIEAIVAMIIVLAIYKVGKRLMKGKR